MATAFRAGPTQGLSDPVTEAARRRLGQSPHLPLHGVTCRHHDGTLVLSGRVPRYYHKQLAQEVVRGVDGVVEVVNRIEVVD